MKSLTSKGIIKSNELYLLFINIQKLLFIHLPLTKWATIYFELKCLMQLLPIPSPSVTNSKFFITRSKFSIILTNFICTRHKMKPITKNV